MAATIELPGVDFAALAREVIAVKLTESLTTSPEAVRSMVLAALGQKVNRENGQEPKSYDRDVCSWVEYVAADLIRQATKKVLAEKVESLRPAIEKAVDAELRRATKSIASALVESYANEAKSGYRVAVSMQWKAEGR